MSAYRQHEQSKQVPIIMLTARADEFDEVIGLEAGADELCDQTCSTTSFISTN